MVKQYLDLCSEILSSPESAFKTSRTGVSTISTFGTQKKYDLSKGYPLLTTKKLPIKPIFGELIWFLRGDSNVEFLLKNGVNIWTDNAYQRYLEGQGLVESFPMYSAEWEADRKEYVGRVTTDKAFAEKHGDLGPVYGKQWRSFETSTGRKIDQFGEALKILKDPAKRDSRRIIVTAWNPEEVENMALPPCHSLYQFNVRGRKLDLQLYQRSADGFLGVPFNIASYAAMDIAVASEVGLEPGTFTHTTGDTHVYCGRGPRADFYQDNFEPTIKPWIHDAEGQQDLLDARDWILETAPPEDVEGLDHIPMMLDQMSREPKPLPHLEIARKPFDQLEITDFKLLNYDAWPTIKGRMAV